MNQVVHNSTNVLGGGESISLNIVQEDEPKSGYDNGKSLGYQGGVSRADNLGEGVGSEGMHTGLEVSNIPRTKKVKDENKTGVNKAEVLEEKIAKALAESAKGGQVGGTAVVSESPIIPIIPIDTETAVIKTGPTNLETMNTNSLVDKSENKPKAPESAEPALGGELGQKIEKIESILKRLNGVKEDRNKAVAKVAELQGEFGDSTGITALDKEVVELGEAVSITKIELQTEISQLVNAAKEKPSIIEDLESNQDAMSLKVVKNAVEDMKKMVSEQKVINSSAGERTEAPSGVEDIRVIDESTVEVLVGEEETLPNAIKNAVDILTGGDTEEIKAVADMAFHSLIEENIKQFEETGEFTHKEVYDKVSDLIKNSKKIRVSLEDGRGIVVEVRKLPEDKVVSPIKTVGSGASDDYFEKRAANL